MPTKIRCHLLVNNKNILLHNHHDIVTLQQCNIGCHILLLTRMICGIYFLSGHYCFWRHIPLLGFISSFLELLCMWYYFILTCASCPIMGKAECCFLRWCLVYVSILKMAFWCCSQKGAVWCVEREWLSCSPTDFLSMVLALIGDFFLNQLLLWLYMINF